MARRPDVGVVADVPPAAERRATMEAARVQRVFVGLGGNVGDAVATLRAAAGALAGLPDARDFVLSPLYRTPAWGRVDQPDFVNAVAAFDTTLGHATCSMRCWRSSCNSAASATRPATTAGGRARWIWTCCCTARRSLHYRD